MEKSDKYFVESNLDNYDKRCCLFNWKLFYMKLKKNLNNCYYGEKYYSPEEVIIFVLWLALNKNFKSNIKLAMEWI